jgi:hypothetical protein
VSLGLRLLVYCAVLTAGTVLGIASVIGHISFSGWLTRLGVTPNACATGCVEGWTVSLIGPLIVMAAATFGLFDRTDRHLSLLALFLLLGYALALRWGPYGVQYGFAALLASLLAYVAGRAGAHLIERNTTS